MAGLATQCVDKACVVARFSRRATSISNHEIREVPRTRQRSQAMTVRTTTAALVSLVWSTFALAQAPAPAPAQTPLPAPTDMAAPSIPGVVAGGAKVEVIKDGFQGTEGPIALPD